MRLLALAALAAICVTGFAHEVPVDWSAECMPPGGAATGARATLTTDAGAYLFTAEDDRGTVAYRVQPGSSAGDRGLFSVSCSVDGRAPFTITQGVVVAGRDRLKREVLPDGTLRLLAMDVVDASADGPGGYMPEPGGHGPCLRIGDTLPVAAHSQGSFTLPLDVDPGAHRIGVRYFDDRDDSARDATIRLTVGGRMLGEWNLTENDDAWHERLFEAEVQRGDLLRVDARTDDSNGHGADFCRISHILIRPLSAADAPPIEATAEDETLVVTQGPRPAMGLPGLRAEIALAGRSLRTQLSQEGVAESPAGFTMLDLLPSADTPGASVVRMPYLVERVGKTADGLLFTTYTDRMTGHCTKSRPVGTADASGTVSVFGPRTYLSNSADLFYPLQETVYITASPRLLDVLPTFPARQATAGRRAIGDRVVFDHWRMATGEGLAEQLRLMDACGMKKLLVIAHTWMHYGYDRKQPQFTPANPDRWTDEQFNAAVAACSEQDYRIAVHENYNHMDWDSPYNSPLPAREFGEPDRPGDPGPGEAAGLVTSDPGPDLSRQPRNAWAFSRLADLRVSPGPLSRPSPPAFPISSDKMLFYSQIESHKIRDTYGTTAGYLDVTPCNEPGIGTWDTHVDLDARNRHARGFGEVYSNAARLFAHHRDIFEISTGEGGTYSTYHAGYIHAVERQVETHMQTPILPEHELRVIRPLSLHHGMGYYSRYFTTNGEDRLPADYDLYRAMTIAFGHAGFMGDDVFPRNIPGPDAIAEYHLMRPVQAAYADAELLAAEYWDKDRWVSTEEGLHTGYDFIQARIRLRYRNGLEVAVNFDRERPWATEVCGQRFELPPKGWAAVCPGLGLTAYTAIVDGAVEDFACCGEYIYRNRRGEQPGHAVYRASGLPGLSERGCAGLLVVAGEAGTQHAALPPGTGVPARLNLTVVNPGEARRVAFDVAGFGRQSGCTARTMANAGGREFARETTWTPPAEGKWRLALAYTYTDPDHAAEATKLEVSDALDGPHLAVAEGAGDSTGVTGSVAHNANFVELKGTVQYETPVRLGVPVRFHLNEIRPGSGTVDNDYVENVRLVLTDGATGRTEEVVFAPVPRLATTHVESLAGGFDLPAYSVTTFELGAGQ